MPKRAKVNLTVNLETGPIYFEQGKVYPDSAVTKEIDASNFENVSTEEVEDNNVEIEGEKKTRRTKKTPGEDLE